jgi:hypothetical protein
MLGPILVLGLVACTQNPPVLTDLSIQIRTVRALAVGAPSNTSCPTDTAPLIGLKKAHIRRVLGEPDDTYRSPDTWYYSLEAPRPEVPLSELEFGGGHRELKFIFKEDGGVERVVCYLSR